MKKYHFLRLLSIAMILVLAVFMLSACGSTNSTTPDASSPASDSGSVAVASSQPEASTAAAPEKAPVSGEIKYNFWGNADQAKAIQDTVNAFQQKEPNVKVDIDFSDWGNYWTKLQTQLAAGSAPDVFAMSTTLYLASYASKGWLADCGDLAQKDGLDLNKYYKAALDLSSYNGKLYGMPQDINTIVLAYNTDMFNKAGLAVPDANTTWDDLLADAQKLTLDKNGKTSLDAGFDPKNVVQWGMSNQGTYIDGYLDPMANSNGEGLVSFDGTKSNILNDASKKSIQYMFDVVWKYHVAPDFNTVPANTDIFVQGKCAIYPLASYMLYPYSQTPNLNYDIIQMPKGTSGKNYNAVQSKGICIFAGSKNIPAAWDFVKYVASEDVYKNVVSTGSGLSPIGQINQDVFLNLNFGPKATKQVYLDALNNPCPIPQSLRIGDANTAMGNDMNDIMSNKSPVDQGAKKMNDDVQAILDDND